MLRLFELDQLDSGASATSALEKAFNYRLLLEKSWRFRVCERLHQKGTEIESWVASNYNRFFQHNAISGDRKLCTGLVREILVLLRESIQQASSSPMVGGLIKLLEQVQSPRSSKLESTLGLVQHGCTKFLSSSDRAIVNDIMDEVRTLCRISRYHWSLIRGADQLGQQAYESLSTPSLLKRMGLWRNNNDASFYRSFYLKLSSCYSGDPVRIMESMSRWLIQQIVTRGETNLQNWKLRFKALQVVLQKTLGMEASLRLDGVFQLLIENSHRLSASVKVEKVARSVARQAATQFQSLLTREGYEFIHDAEELKELGYSILSELAVLHASGALENHSPALAHFWCNRALPRFPFPDHERRCRFMDVLIGQLMLQTNKKELSSFYEHVTYFETVLSRTQLAERMAENLEHFPQFEMTQNIPVMDQEKHRALAHLPRHILIGMITFIPYGRGDTDVCEFRKWLHELICPQFDKYGVVLRTAIEHIWANLVFLGVPEAEVYLNRFLEGAEKTIGSEQKVNQWEWKNQVRRRPEGQITEQLRVLGELDMPSDTFPVPSPDLFTQLIESTN